jgi:hypothetical protein
VRTAPPPASAPGLTSRMRTFFATRGADLLATMAKFDATRRGRLGTVLPHPPTHPPTPPPLLCVDGPSCVADRCSAALWCGVVVQG